MENFALSRGFAGPGSKYEHQLRGKNKFKSTVLHVRMLVK